MTNLYFKSQFNPWKTNNSINDFKGWHYLAVKKRLSALLRWIASKHHGDYYCLNCFHSFRTEDKPKSHQKVCKNKDLCGTVMPSEKDKIIEFRHYIKSDKILNII